jgi:cytochrome c oxidase subunit 1/cytochrome c oxidase subunit I+III
VLAAGLLVILGNLIWSLRRGARAGPDPFGGATLEWAVPSPPPEYNFAVIPTVKSAYPNWDRDDRQEDVRRLNRGELVLDRGHETPASSVLDGELDEILEMPAESPWPVTLALCVAVVFTMLLTSHYYVAGLAGAAAALVLMAWHSREPAEP